MPSSSYVINAVYHFTDIRNLPSIRKHGLLSSHQIRRRSDVDLVAPGGNDWSQEADSIFGVDRYVHLCFFQEHPMEYLARQSGRITSTVFIRIAPTVILEPNVLFCKEVSNKSGASLVPYAQASDFDWEVICARTNWKDKSVQDRLRAARKYEILVPDHIPLNLIKNI